MQQLPDVFLWESEVRAYELDSQGIVNNAHYFHYFDHVRVKHLHAKGVDWMQWHQHGFDLVLIHSDITFKAPLRAHEAYYVSSQIQKSGKLRMMFEQAIYKTGSNLLIATAMNTVVCVNHQTQRPCIPEKLEALLF